MRKYINILYVTLLSLLFISCSSEVEEAAFHCVLDMDANVPSFTSVSTRAATNWKDGDVVYLYIPSSGVYGYAVYSSSINKWNAYFSGKPADATSSSITVRYFDGSSQKGNSIKLYWFDAAYSDTSVKYSYSVADGMKLTANLKPDLGRIRFKGQSGDVIGVMGIQTRDTYNRSTDTFSNNGTAEFTLIVNSDGYTDYIYGEFANSSRMLTLVSKGITYTTYCSANMYKAGQTGYITIPTESSHSGWATDKEDTNGNITVEEDFDNEECWDQQLSQSANITVNEIGGTEVSWDGIDKNVSHASHDYVDLGLPSGLKWATCNIGADKPEDYGDYYAWGETTTKTGYSWENYKYRQGRLIAKYCANYSYGTVDYKTVLDPEDDAAHVNWGGGWRMPTIEELNELIENCTWTWTSQNGVNGYKVSSNTNGNSFFLPAAGYRDDDSFRYRETGGKYSSSSLYSPNYQRARCLNFYSSSNYSSIYDDPRHIGYSVRAVCP